ncbi:hypothetical protein RclHR1_14020003 [Rhizophagus clarus]|uniref:Protein kinase domain-containing protein n=1 Tax=Rhizophagus clarus TaxID=94130 RepID=A0A2Z6QRC4_9GLOM|nr:hypothetical protein RclHR1_14020003 [Rhizophagus clarus]
MKFLKEWIFEIGEKNDGIDYFFYNEFSNIGEIDEEIVNETFKKADLENQGITVAIKNLNNPKINENDFREFITTLKSFRKINHPNVNRFLGLTRDPNENYFLVWEYANEGNLRDYLKSKFSMLEWNDKIQMALEITCGLMFLHSKQIIHENLQAYTVLIKNGRLMITDFGLSVEAASAISENIVYVEPRHLRDPSYKRDMRSDIYSLGVLLWELSSGFQPFFNHGQGEFSSIQTSIIDGKREDPIENTPLEYQELYQKCWQDNPDERPEINEVHEILTQLNLRFKIFNDLSTKQQIIERFKLNYGLITTEDNITPSMKKIFNEDGKLNMSLYEEQPMVYIDINMNDLRSYDTCINFPIAEITNNADPLETFDNDDESFDNFFTKKILIGSILFIKEFSSATQTQIDILKFYLFCAYNSSKYSTEIQFNNLFDLNLLPKIVTLDGEELNTHEKLIEWTNNLCQYKIIDIISYDLIPISQLKYNTSLINDPKSFSEKLPGIAKFKEKLSLQKWVGNTMYNNLVNWADNLHLFKGLIINNDYGMRISNKFAVNFDEIPRVNLSDEAYSKSITPSTNLEVILVSNNIFSIKDLSTFPFIKNDVKNYEDYIHTLFKRERYEILLNKDHTRPTKEFEQLIENAFNSMKPLKALQDIFNEYGHLFPQRIILGWSLKNISPITIKIDLEQPTYYDLNSSYLLTREGEVVEKNDVYNWFRNINNNLEIIEFDNIIPFYKILKVEQQKKIDDILNNDFKVIMTGVTDLKDLDNNNILHYKRINLNPKSVLENEDYKVFGSIISEDNTKLEEICVNFGLFDFSGFYAIIKKLKETNVDITKCFVLWMIVGNPSKLQVLSPKNREIKINYVKETINLQTSKSNYCIKAPFRLSLGYAISIHAYYPSTNYEPINIIKAVEWNDEFINIQMSNKSNKITQSQSMTSYDIVADLHICILYTNYKRLKIDGGECDYSDYSLDLIGYILTKENLNEKLPNGIHELEVQKEILIGIFY